MSRKRNHQVKIYMNTQELNKLEEKCKLTGQSKQAYIINAVDDSVIATAEEVDLLKAISNQFAEFIRILRGLATNINQQAKHANETGRVEAANILAEQNQQLGNLRKEGESIWQSLRQLIEKQNHTVR